MCASYIYLCTHFSIYHHMTCGDNFWNQDILTCTNIKSGSCKTRDVVTATPQVESRGLCLWLKFYSNIIKSELCLILYLTNTIRCITLFIYL